MQNKANFRMAQQRLTAGQEKGYVKRYELCVCENKANLSARACSVPVRHRRGRPPCLPIPGGQPQGVAPTSRPACKTKPICRAKVDANAGMGKGL